MKHFFTKLVVSFSTILCLLNSLYAQQGGAIRLNGGTDFLATPTTTALNINETTIEFWIYWEASGTKIDFICSRALEQFEIHTGGGFANNLRFIPTTGVYIDAGINAFTSNAWNHVACVYKPSIGLGQIYVNGTPTASISSGTNPLTTPIAASSSGLVIGNRQGGGFPYTGAIDEFRIWSKARTHSEIQDNMNCQIEDNACGLILNYHFNQGIGGANNTSILEAVNSATGPNAILFNLSLNNTLSNFISPGAISNSVYCQSAILGLREKCNNVLLTATGGISYAWNYGSQPSLATQLFDTTGIYSVTINQPNGCTWTDTAHVTILPGPPAPIAADTQFFCGSAKAGYLRVSNPNKKVYLNNSGGIAIADTATLLDSTIYYVSQIIDSCESDLRKPIFVIIDLTKSALVTNTNQSFCGAQTIAQLQVTGSNLLWFDTLVGGTALTLSAPVLGNKTYYVVQQIPFCSTLARVAVNVNINPIPAAPFTNNTQLICGLGVVNDLIAIGTSIKWYDTAVAGSVLLGSNSLIQNKTYYASQTINNCESTTRDSLTLIIRQSTNRFDTLSVCDSIVWNGNKYDSSGNYTYTTIGSNGCDSIVHLSLTVKYSSVTPLVTASACGSYLWNGTTYTTSGLKTYTTTNIVGCDSIVRLQLTINPFPVIDAIVKDTAICDQQTVTILGKYFGSIELERNGFDIPNAVVTASTADSLAIPFPLLSPPAYFSLDDSNNVYVIDQFNEKVFKYSADGSMQHVLVLDAASTLGEIVRGYIVDKNGTQYVLTTSNRVWRKAITDAFYIPIFGLVNSGSSVGMLLYPDKLMLDSSGGLYVFDLFNNRVQKWKDGVITVVAGSVNGVNYPTGPYNNPVNLELSGIPIYSSMTIDLEGNVYLANNITHKVEKWLANGNGFTIVAGNGMNGSGIGEINYASDLLVNSRGDIFTLESQYLQIKKFDAGLPNSGKFVLGTPLPTSSNYGFAAFNNKPQLAFDSYGNIWASDENNSRILRFKVKDALAKFKATNTTTYQFTLSSQPGCANAKDSINIKSTFVAIDTISACSNQLPFTWRGNTYSTNGLFTDNRDSLSTCDTTFKLFFTIKNTTTSLTSISSCASYTWNGITYTTSGLKSYLSTNSIGCDSIAYLNLTIITLPTTRSLQAVTDSIYENNPGLVSVINSDELASYQLVNANTLATISNKSFGNGDTLLIPTQNLTSTTPIRVQATRLTKKAIEFQSPTSSMRIAQNLINHDSGTFETWVRKADWSQWTDEILMGVSINPFNPQAFYLSINPFVGLHFRYGSVAEGTYVSNGSIIGFASNSWHHFACTWKRESGTLTMKLYIDGVFTDSINTTHSIMTPYLPNFQIGGQASPTKFAMDEVRLWNKVKSDTEILANINANTLANRVGLVGYWRINLQEYSELFDSSGNNHSLIANNIDTSASYVLGKIAVEETLCAPIVLVDSTQIFARKRLLAPVENITICENNLPFIWRADTIYSTISSIYYDTLIAVNANLDDSVFRLNLTINPKPATSAIAGNPTPGLNTIETYNVVSTVGSSYTWFIQNGTQINGGNTHQIQVQWPNAIAFANVKVIETAVNGCIGDTISLGVTLPVRWLSFSGKKVQKGNLLNWTTAFEFNNSHFVIERSIDGTTFLPLGQINGSKQSNTLISYQYLDSFSSVGTQAAFYRLQQVDYDGEFAYSNIIFIANTLQLQVNEINAYPNPFTRDVLIELDMVENGEVMVSLVDVEGKVIKTQHWQVATGNVTLPLNQLETLAVGVYYLKVTTADKLQIIKLLKTN